MRYRLVGMYIAADIIGGLRYSGYSWLDQGFVELTAQGAPTRPLMVALTEFPYNLLVLAFAAALSTSAGPKRRAARIVAAGLVGYTGFGFVAGTITPMATREAMAASRPGHATQRLPRAADVGEQPLLGGGHGLRGPVARQGVPVLHIRQYRGTPRVWYLDQLADSADGGKPTDALDGAEGAHNIYATMLWVAVLAIGLLRTQDGPGGGHDFGSVRADRGRQCAGRSRRAPTVPASCTGRSSRALRATPGRTGAGESAVVAVVGVARKSMRSRGC